MNYEEKYKEALEDMRVIYPNLKGDAKLAVEHAFPELRESEDERIRKWLIEECLKVINMNCPAYDTSKAEKAVAWLEKQKEQKPAEWSEEDEEILQSIIKDFRAGKVSTIGQEQWLKSLRPRWKPSEVQLNYLLMLADYFESEGGTSNAKSLRKLYEQLKKL